MTNKYGQCLLESGEPIPGVFASGDAALFRHIATGEQFPVLLAGPTARASRLCAWNAMNAEAMKEIPPASANSILRIFDQYIGQVGASFKHLKRANVDFREVHATWTSKPEWFPGFTPIHVSARFEKGTDRLIGASVASSCADVAKILDTLSVYVQLHGTSADLAEFELAYAPVVAGPKSVVNFIGNVAQNELLGLSKTVTPEEVMENNIPLVDVRPPMMRKNMGWIKGSINIPLATIRDSSDLPEGKFAVICKSGKFSHTAFRALLQKGCDVSNVSGGFFAFGRKFPHMVCKK
ncbi:hypothetical protein GEMRC1_012106 [Eukaryota sp. GEM-RC1]